MKILIVHPSVELYGADKILLYILEILNSNNHDITVLLPKDGILISYIKNISPKIKVLINNDIPIAHSKLKFKEYLCIPKKISKMNKLFSHNSFDMLYCNTLATVLLLFTGWFRNRILHVHEIIENKILNFAFSVLLRARTGNVICVSERVRKNLIFSKGYYVVHNGIPDIAGDIVLNEIDEKVSFVLPGRYMPKKGQWFLIEALKKLPDEYKHKLQIYLFGSPPPSHQEYKTELQEAIKNAKLEQVVKLNPFVEDISQLYKKGNVILVPSLMADPFPTTVLESLMFSRPVIVTNNGGAVEILDESFAKIISPNDIDQFSNALKFFIDNKNKIKKMGNSAREKYETELTINIFKKKFISTLNNMDIIL